MSAFCAYTYLTLMKSILTNLSGQALAAERSSSAGIEAFQTLEKRAQTEVLRDEMEATLTIRRNRAAQRRALAREEKYGLTSILTQFVLGSILNIVIDVADATRLR